MSEEDRAKLSEMRQAVRSQRQYLKDVLRGQAECQSLRVEYLKFAAMRYELRKWINDDGRAACHRVREAI